MYHHKTNRLNNYLHICRQQQLTKTHRLTNFSFRQKLYAYVWWVERTYRTVCMVRNKICVFHNVIAIIFIAVVYDIKRTTNTFSLSRKTTHTPTNMQKTLLISWLWRLFEGLSPSFTTLLLLFSTNHSPVLATVYPCMNSCDFLSILR